jgi:galactose mutarotase-like enzyme
VTILPELGGKIASLVLAGREWLWTSDVLPHRLPVDGASYVETADSGGYDECFPTVGPCRIPGAVRGVGGVELPDHGELWAQEVALEASRVNGADQVLTTWRGRRLPYWFSRAVRVLPDGSVAMHYVATNAGDAPLPFLWSAHPLLPLTARTRLELPEGARVRVYAQHGAQLGGPLAEHRWPFVEVDGRTADLRRPDAAFGRDYACKLFLDMPVGRAAIEEDGARLEVAFDVGEVPHFGLWLNRHGWTPFADGEPYRNLAFEPCIGAPDTLDDALGAWRSAFWLGPGEARSWNLTWSAAPVAAAPTGGR